MFRRIAARMAARKSLFRHVASPNRLEPLVLFGPKNPEDYLATFASSIITG